jgi:hypothetical protein
MNMNYDKVTLEAVGWPVLWGSGQPEATVLATGVNVFLVHPARAPGAWAIVRFTRPEGVRYGGPNLEVIEAHPLGSRAIPGELYILRGSPWHQEMEAMNAVHAQYETERWTRINHYFSFLWDHTFECLAMGVEGEAIQMSFLEVMAHVASRVLVSR